jgi:hypothetical protein
MVPNMCIVTLAPTITVIERARLSTSDPAYGSAAGIVENLLVDTGC